MGIAESAIREISSEVWCASAKESSRTPILRQTANHVKKDMMFIK
jgi:hypothetical protein